MFKMRQRFKHITNRIISKLVPQKLLLYKFSIIKAKKIFEKAPEESIWLEREILDSLQEKYPYPPEYGYDPQSLVNRGTKRARKILKLLRTDKELINTFLELGCCDGMVSCALQRMGKITTAIDKRSTGLDERAVNEGVKFLQMDATKLQFEDESFDFVFSFDTFEHLTEPELVLKEAIRVVKKGGYIFIEFGPLYMSPMGLHAYRSITVPYCQFLFPKELLIDFVMVEGLQPIDFDQINEWSLEDYRKLWKQHSHQLKKVRYHEKLDTSHVDLITKYPSCFKNRTKYFDNLIVQSIEVLFKKIS